MSETYYLPQKKKLDFIVFILYCHAANFKTMSHCFKSNNLSRNNGEFGAKKYFTDHRAAKAIQLFVAMREVFLLYYFSEQAPAKGNFPETTL